MSSKSYLTKFKKMPMRQKITVLLTGSLLITIFASLLLILLPVQNSASMSLAEADRILDRSETLMNIFMSLVGLQVVGLVIVNIYDRQKITKKQSKK